MSTFIALFRGINVGGNRILPMKALKAVLEDLDFKSVQTYIQSGNVVFESTSDDPAKIETDIGDAVAASFGFRPDILILSREKLSKIIANNPFPEATEAPKSLHVYFLKTPPVNPDFDKLNVISTADERYFLTPDAFYLHTPTGFGVSKLAEKAEKILSVSATARNWNTVMKLIKLSEDALRAAT